MSHKYLYAMSLIFFLLFIMSCDSPNFWRGIRGIVSINIKIHFVLTVFYIRIDYIRIDRKKTLMEIIYTISFYARRIVCGGDN